MEQASNMAAMVREMHEHLGAHVNYGEPSTDIPANLRDIRIALLDEEVGEYREAALAGDLVGIADGLADLIYVAYGTAQTYGIPIDDVLAEVHRSNMTKQPNPDGGKFIKGADFSPADIHAVLSGHPCGHASAQRGCGGCDPGAVEYVRDDGGPWRKIEAMEVDQ